MRRLMAVAVLMGLSFAPVALAEAATTLPGLAKNAPGSSDSSLHIVHEALVRTLEMLEDQPRHGSDAPITIVGARDSSVPVLTALTPILVKDGRLLSAGRKVRLAETVVAGLLANHGSVGVHVRVSATAEMLDLEPGDMIVVWPMAADNALLPAIYQKTCTCRCMNSSSPGDTPYEAIDAGFWQCETLNEAVCVTAEGGLGTFSDCKKRYIDVP